MLSNSADLDSISTPSHPKMKAPKTAKADDESLDKSKSDKEIDIPNPKHKVFRAEVPKSIINKNSVSSVPELRQNPHPINLPSVSNKPKLKPIKPRVQPTPEPEPVKPEPVKPEPVKPEPVKPQPVNPQPETEKPQSPPDQIENKETKFTNLNNKDKIQVFSDDDDDAYDKHLEESRAKVVDHFVSTPVLISD
jgi:hypothetical protein